MLRKGTVKLSAEGSSSIELGASLYTGLWLKVTSFQVTKAGPVVRQTQCVRFWL